MNNVPTRPSEDAAGQWLVDAVPGAVLAVAVALLVSRFVHATNGVWAVLVGLVGVAVAVATSAILSLLDGSDRTAEVTGSPTPPLTASLVDQMAMARAEAARSSVSVPTAPTPPSAKATAITGARPWDPRVRTGLTTMPDATTISKLGNTPEENEDAFAFDAAMGRLVVADGASSSFASRDWSRALCDEFITDLHAVDSVQTIQTAVANAAQRWSAAVTPTGEVPWWAQQGLERGAFATLLAVDVTTVKSGQRWRAFAIGDSCLAQLRRADGVWRIVTSFPIQPSESFTSYPHLVQTANVADSAAGLCWAEGELVNGDVLIVATDAVSEWLLGEDSARAAHYLAEAPMEQLDAEFIRLREERLMVNDDCTVIRLVAGRELR